jgi:hypothetical protein
MSPEVVLEKLVSDEYGTNLTGDEPFWAFGDDVVGQPAHVNKIVACETPCLVMLIIHVPWCFGFKDIDLANVAHVELVAHRLVVFHVLTLARVPTITLYMIRWTLTENMPRHLQMSGLERTVGATPDFRITVHQQVVHTERLGFWVLMQGTRHGTENTFLLGGALHTVLVEIQVAFHADQTNPLHRVAWDLTVVAFSTLEA